jgi:hypothetical protein
MSSIFLVGNDDGLTELTKRAYDSEGLLQQLIAKYPGVLAGDQIDPTSPRRWLLVSREVSVPGDESGYHKWRLDHLFLDQDAVPTLVEVKRSSDPRLRREVVGQMLDYAANGVAYWPVERLQTAFEGRCQREGLDPEQALSELIGNADVENYWELVKKNLQVGRIRLVFLADEIPNEVRRIVEFLNQQMEETEVLAIEIDNYMSADGSLRTLVPRVIGQSELARQRKSTSPRKALTLVEFVASIPTNLLPSWERLRSVIAPYIGTTVREQIFVKTTNYRRTSDNHFLLWITVSPDKLTFGLNPKFVRDESRVVGATDAGNAIIAVRSVGDVEAVESWIRDYLGAELVETSAGVAV